jgi:hypothetical protein
MIIPGIYRLMKHPFLQINYVHTMVKNARPKKGKCIKCTKIGQMKNARPRKKNACLVLVIVC